MTSNQLRYHDYLIFVPLKMHATTVAYMATDIIKQKQKSWKRPFVGLKCRHLN